MTIKELKKATLKTYTDGSRTFGDFWSDEIAQCFDNIVNYQDDQEIDQDILDEITEAEDTLGELADGMVDVYTTNLLKWYSEELHRTSYADDYIEEFGVESAGSLSKILMGGQYTYWNEALNITLDAIKETIEELELAEELEAKEDAEIKEAMDKVKNGK